MALPIVQLISTGCADPGRSVASLPAASSHPVVVTYRADCPEHGRENVEVPGGIEHDHYDECGEHERCRYGRSNLCWHLRGDGVDPALFRTPPCQRTDAQQETPASKKRGICCHWSECNGGGSSILDVPFPVRSGSGVAASRVDGLSRPRLRGSPPRPDSDPDMAQGRPR